MSLVKAEGIILRRIRLGETSKILTVLTPTCGKVRMVAKGARKPKHRFGSSLEPFTVGSFVYYSRENRELQILSQCDAEEDFPQFARDLRHLAYGSGVLELADKVVLEGESTADVYALVIQVLLRMADAPGEELPLWWWAYQLKLLAALGYSPEFGRCERCGREIDGKRVRFAPEAGGVRCSGCASGGEIELTAGSLRALQFLSRASWEETRALRVSRAQAGEIQTLLERFFVGQFGDSVRIRSLGILRSVPKAKKREGQSGGFSDADHAA